MPKSDEAPIAPDPTPEPPAPYVPTTLEDWKAEAGKNAAVLQVARSNEARAVFLSYMLLGVVVLAMGGMFWVSYEHGREVTKLNGAKVAAESRVSAAEEAVTSQWLDAYEKGYLDAAWDSLDNKLRYQFLEDRKNGQLQIWQKQSAVPREFPEASVEALMPDNLPELPQLDKKKK